MWKRRFIPGIYIEEIKRFELHMEMCILQVMRGHGFAVFFVFRYVIISFCDEFFFGGVIKIFMIKLDARNI